MSDTKNSTNCKEEKDMLPLYTEKVTVRYEDEECRAKKNWRRNLMFIILLGLISVLILYSNQCYSSVDTFESLGLEPMIRDHGDYYGEKMYKPEQLHLSLGVNSSEIVVTFSTIDRVENAIVTYCEVEDQGTDCNGVENVAMTSRDVIPVYESDPNWIEVTRGSNWRNLYVYRARLEGLKSERTYMYRAVTKADPEGKSIFYSNTYHFDVKNISNPFTEVFLAMYGDLGLINGQSIPRLTKDADQKKYDAIIHNGDFAYDLNTHHGQYGDEFMRKIEPIAARVPYQVSVGNHEIALNFTYYDSRFSMLNSGGVNNGEQNNFYYSFNVGPVHFVAFSTEFYYFLDRVGMPALSNQYMWLKKDLEHASSPTERALRPWIIVFGHRPMYCSSRSGDDCSKENNMLRKGLPFTHSFALEKLFYDYGVDVELYSHEHQYERFLPIYDGKIYNGTEHNPYRDPMAPVHIISGSAGCQERLDPFKGKPVTGSVKQISDYGFTTLRASHDELQFQQVSDDQGGLIVDGFTISKSKQNFGKGKW